MSLVVVGIHASLEFAFKKGMSKPHCLNINIFGNLHRVLAPAAYTSMLFTLLKFNIDVKNTTLCYT